MKTDEFVCAACFCLFMLLLFNGCTGKENSTAKTGADRVIASSALATSATPTTVSYPKMEKQFVLMDAKALEYYNKGAEEQKKANYENAVKDYQKARTIYMNLFEWYNGVGNNDKTGVYQAFVKDCNDRLSELRAI